MVPDWDLKRRLSPVILLHDLLFFFCFLQPSKKTKVTLEKATELALGGSVLHLSCRTPHKSTFYCNFPGLIWLFDRKLS
jgi:hypothetical protein